YHSSNHLYFSCSASDPVLHSFPTRRSSDLRTFGKVVGGARHAAVSPKSKWLAVHGLIGIDFFDILAGERLYHLLAPRDAVRGRRSEEHTSELQSQSNLVCRLLLEKKKRKKK